MIFALALISQVTQVGAPEGEMMDDGQSLTLFVFVIAFLSVAVAVGLPVMMARLPLRRAVPVLALVGPLLAIIGALVGTGAMSLSGHDAKYVLIVTVLTGFSAIFVGLRLARPLASDLSDVSSTVASIAMGDRSARTGIVRTDELGDLALAVDELGRSLARSEVERDAAQDERRAVVSALSHDLRTPLASLLASIDAIEDGVAQVPDHLPAMRKNVLALNRLVEDLFLLARADSGNLALQAEDLDMAELVDEAIEAMTPAAREQHVSLAADFDSAIPVSGDATAIGRVLRNLLDNAVRHSPAQSTVSVEVGVSDEQVVVVVADEGPGFDSEFVPRALERFTQHDDARSRTGGAGLGLAIAQTLTEAHGGTVCVSAGPGGRVEVRIPSSGSVVGAQFCR